MYLDAEKSKQWIEREKDPIVRAIKEKIIANLNFVSADKFKADLIKSTVMAFSQIKGD